VTATDPGPVAVVETTSTAFDIETVYRQYSGRCFSLAVRVVRDRQLAQDVVQEVRSATTRERGCARRWLCCDRRNAP
jgi:DNA-directed RNA polymerase specialized sigma24 family protein